MNSRTPEIEYMELASDVLSAWTPGGLAPASPEAQVIDLFSGCGGMSLGFAALGHATQAFRLVGAADVNEASLGTYECNFEVNALNRDVRLLARDRDALKAFLDELDEYDSSLPLVLIGCAPCQGFSAHRKKTWDQDDDRNDLVSAFAEVAASLAPECVIMENVPELLSGRYWSYFAQFKHRLEAEGYTVKQAIHNSAEYGVPQERFRALVVAMRDPNFSLPKPRLAPDRFRTVRDAIGDLPRVKAGEVIAEDPMHRSAAHRESTLDVIRAVPRDGGSRPPGVGPDCLDRIRGFRDVYGRLAWDKPSITITHYARNPASGRFVHPEQHRGLSPREVARLQGFPDGFEFTGSFDDIFRQIGEAVPPPLSTAVAAATLANLRVENDVMSFDEIVDRPVNDSFAGVIAGIKMGRK